MSFRYKRYFKAIDWKNDPHKHEPKTKPITALSFSET